MNFKTSERLSDTQVQRGLKLIVADGLTAETMTTLTGGTFLVALAVQLGATNFQIGLLAALPTFTNIFQVISIWLVQRYNNRRAVMVICSFLARLPLFAIALLPLLFSKGTSIQALIFLLSFHYFFGSIAGASWNSWMKDLIPQAILGSYFSRRSRLMQTLNVVLSMSLALCMDVVKKTYPQQELTIYALMFLAGGIVGMAGVYALSRTPEPASILPKEAISKLLLKPLRDTNFRRLLIFQSVWSFALNMVGPFFAVYMMKTLGLPLVYVIVFGLLSQLSSILSIQWWGRLTDRYSNKTILQLCAPLYIICLFAWSFAAMASSGFYTIVMLAIIHLLSGTALAGVNLAINNLGLKLAPHREAIVYISARNITIAFIAALGPVCGGWCSDFFTSHTHPVVDTTVSSYVWSLLFLTGGLIAIGTLPLLKPIYEEGEADRRLVLQSIRQSLRQLRGIKAAA